jgi:2-iminobutanoate/2-iminopropanoate deaminase
MNGVYAPFFSEPRPARTTVQVGALPGGIKVEIDCVVRLP